MRIKLVILLSLMLLFSVTINAEEAKEGVEKSERAKLKADRLRYKKDENLYIGNGNIRLDYDGNLITSNKLRLERDDNIAYFSEDVYLQRESGDKIKSDKLEFDIDNDILVAEDDVKLDSKKDNKPLKLSSEYLKVWTENDNMEAKQNVFVLYDGQEIQGESLNYDGQKDEMLVKEDVELKEDGQWLKSDKIIIYIKKGDFDATGNVQMEFDI
ncbi:OstA-like protein [Orenia metallireducens]|jgi:lipopolysaccharide assembly outer membrane protein LptD (OstA)|uniref:OstA-like protein n=1 Tax=Orenia metallireducens TaxID=1413210 RepID=A0A285GLJ6_9FIRM|nr:LptA/OstA family protein [Orenia metallireducens]PRX35731.1 OstA-like protein [Orenia metallireducens]SNY24308.1 OstA-like protein [Orenia metallireducens]